MSAWGFVCMRRTGGDRTVNESGKGGRRGESGIDFCEHICRRKRVTCDAARPSSTEFKQTVLATYGFSKAEHEITFKYEVGIPTTWYHQPWCVLSTEIGNVLFKRYLSLSNNRQESAHRWTYRTLS